MERWYNACAETASIIYEKIPEYYRSRTFSGIIGDIKALTPKKAGSLIGRKKGLGLQYAYLYLIKGIDWGRGYQACASEALKTILGHEIKKLSGGKILDVGCAVGVSGGILGLDNVTGFDLFPDLLNVAKTVDTITGKKNDYVCADMTGTWPFAGVFNTVICSLVCHHLKEQEHAVRFFNETNRVLKTGGKLIITLPSGSVTNASQLSAITRGFEDFGFRTAENFSGAVVSADNINSVFWMFVIVAEKIANKSGKVFLNEKFDFTDFKTMETRVKKGEKAKKTAVSERAVKHEMFRLITIDDLIENHPDMNFIFPDIYRLLGDNPV